MSYRESILFKGLSKKELDSLLSREDVKIRSYNKGQHIFYQGDSPEELYILIKGRVILEKVDINGKRQLVNIFYKPGSIFAEVYLYLENKSYDYQARLTEDTELLSLSKDFFKHIYKEDTSLSAKLLANMLEILAKKAFYLNQKLLITSSYSLRQKIINYLFMEIEDSYSLELSLNRQEMADFIGSTRPSLSRELMSMEDDGLIEVSRDKILIKNIDKLEELS